jgi:hypothetical protein
MEDGSLKQLSSFHGRLEELPIAVPLLKFTILTLHILEFVTLRVGWEFLEGFNCEIEFSECDNEYNDVRSRCLLWMID